MTVILNDDAIRRDFQHVALLQEVAEAIVDTAQDYTKVNIQVARSEVELENGVPIVTVGAKAAAAVSVEFGTRYRHASAPIRRAAMALGLKVPN
jgi:hypothetical protein